MFIATPVKVLRRPLESAQYLSIKYTERLAEAGIELSVGSIGDVRQCPRGNRQWPLQGRGYHSAGTVEAVEFITLEWADRFNNHRLLVPIGNIPPAEAEESYYASGSFAVTLMNPCVRSNR